jgi:hypothetical protein
MDGSSTEPCSSPDMRTSADGEPKKQKQIIAGIIIEKGFIFLFQPKNRFKNSYKILNYINKLNDEPAEIKIKDYYSQ